MDMSGSGTLSLNTTNNRPITTGNGLFTTGGDLTTVGTTTVSGNFVVAGNLSTPKGSDYSTTGAQNDVNLGTGSLFRYTGAGTATFTGLAGGVDGRQIRIMNASASTLTIAHQDTNSTDINRIITSSGSSVSVPLATTIVLQYDAGASRWRILTVTLTQTSISGFAFFTKRKCFWCYSNSWYYRC